MKRQISAAVMTLALLGGGLLSAAPANAAPAPKITSAAVDKEIKANKEKLRILKLKLSTDKTVGNSSDKKARDYYNTSKRDLQASKDASCSATGVRIVLNEVTTVNYSAAQKKKKDAIQADEKKFQSDKSRNQAFSQVRLKLSKSSEKAGIVFKHQRTSKAYSYDSNLGCSAKALKQAKATFAKYNKSLTTKERAAINKRIAALSVHSPKAEAGERAKNANFKRNVAFADKTVKKDIQQAEKRVKNLEIIKKIAFPKK